jgi:hypothetical protein
MRKVIISAISLLLLNSVAIAKEDDDASTPGADRCPKLQASTIFVPDKAGSRQKGSAKKISQTHDVAEAQGWNFHDLEVYIEDGDLQGFFVTYTREHPCNNR